MRKVLLLGVATAACGWAAAANATAMIAFQIYDGSNLIASGSNAPGSITLAGKDTSFSVDGSAAAYPTLASPNFATNNFTTQSSGAGGTVTIKITETGLTGFVGNVMNTFTLNSLSSSAFTSGTITNYFDASNAAYGMGTTLASATYSGSNSFSSSQGTFASMPGTFSETAVYTLNFASGSSGSVSASSQLIAVPEPASLGLLGAGLAAVGFIRRRRRAV